MERNTIKRVFFVTFLATGCIGRDMRPDLNSSGSMPSESKTTSVPIPTPDTNAPACVVVYNGKPVTGTGGVGTEREEAGAPLDDLEGLLVVIDIDGTPLGGINNPTEFSNTDDALKAVEGKSGPYFICEATVRNSGEKKDA